MRSISTSIAVVALAFGCVACNENRRTADADRTAATEGERARAAGDRAAGAAERAGDRAAGAAERAGDKMERGAERAGDKMERGAERAGDKMENAKDKTGRGLDNMATTTAVKSKLAADVRLSTITDINVDTHGDVVTLTGHVPTAADKRKAEQVALTVDGVKRVVNNLAVKRN